MLLSLIKLWAFSNIFKCFNNYLTSQSPVSSVTQSCLTLCDPMNRTQHARPPCPSPTPGVHSNSCPLSQWCHPTISSSVILFSSHPQSFPASGSLPMSPFFSSGGQNIGVSASTSVLPRNTQDWSPLGWTGWISLQRLVQPNYFQLFASWRCRQAHLWPSNYNIKMLYEEKVISAW